MSRRNKAAARLREIARRRKTEDHTSHLTALRNAPVVDVAAAAAAVRAETPILAGVIQRFALVPEPPCTWEQGTTLLPLVAVSAAPALVGA